MSTQIIIEETMAPTAGQARSSTAPNTGREKQHANSTTQHQAAAQRVHSRPAAAGAPGVAAAVSKVNAAVEELHEQLEVRYCKHMATIANTSMLEEAYKAAEVKSACKK